METNDIGDNNIPESPQDNEHSEIQLSDVLDVLRDEMFQNNPSNVGSGGGMGGAGAQAIDPTQPSTTNYNGATILQPQQQQQQQQQQMQQQQQQQQQSNAKNIRHTAHVKITEQPAGKALRFRYVCEGRSAGSIPGIDSTAEKKTFPTIEIVGYKGRAFVVVSCVTKDPPYRPHPHNLVGKEGCKKGVCTIEVNSETMRAVFSNLGIQCVKKKEIETALQTRESMRVDPFKTGFSHKFQPSSIDLNAVRLCFQVFLEGDKGRFTVPLTPVVSDPIFDKKAMSDLVICRLCSCSSTVYGGKEIILLCEKIAKEDISVRFFEEHNGHLVWEGFGEFQHTDVHKQTAITFKTPRYRKLEIEQPAKVFIQLRRPSDGATSEPLPFDYLPLESGRRTFWAIRKNLKRKADMGIFQQILNEDKAATLAAQNAIPKYQEVGVQSDIINLDTPTEEEDQSKSFGTDDEESTKRRMEKEVDSIIDEKIKELELEVRVPEQYQHANTQTQDSTPQTEEGDEESVKEDTALEPRQLSANDKITEWLKSSEEFERTDSGTPPANDPATAMTASTVVTSEEDKTLNDLLDQSEELDEIYTDSKLRLVTYNNTLANELSSVEGSQTKEPTAPMDVDESFDDAATYTSLEMAFKNPYPMSDVMAPVMQLPPERADHYDSVEIIVNPPAPIIDLVNVPSPMSNSSSVVGDENVPPLPPKRIRKQEANVQLRNSPTSPARPPSQIIIMKTPDQSPPTKKLPPTPNNNTLPRQKKPGFFSKLFSRRKSKSDLSQTASSPGSKAASPVGSREPSVAHFSLNDTNRSSIRSLKSLQPTSISATSSPTNGAKPDPAILKRKRQKIGDASVYLSRHIQAQELQQQQQQQQHHQQHAQHQSDHPDGQAQLGPTFLNVMGNAVKTEPGDTSPLPYGMYHNAYRMADQTPSPQPVSPSNPYNNASGTPSPYNMGGATGNGNMMSPNHNYGMAGGGPATVNGYDAYHQQHQQPHASTMNPFNQMQSPPAHTAQQWPGAAAIKQSMPNINNLTNFNVNNLIVKTAAPSAAVPSTQANNNQPWNLPAGAMPNNNNYINHLMNNTQHNQHHHHQQQSHHNPNNVDGQEMGEAAAAAGAASTNDAPTISSLLNMDSEQLMHFNSAELSSLSLS